MREKEREREIEKCWRMDTEEDIVIGKNMQTKSIHEQRERERKKRTDHKSTEMRKIVKRLTKKDKRESNRDIEKIEQLK